MRNEGRRSKIIKAIVICLLITAIGGVAYAIIHRTSPRVIHSKTDITTTHHSVYKSTQEKLAAPANASAAPPALTNQQVTPSQNSAPISQGASISQPSPPVTPQVAQGCQPNSQAFAQANQINIELGQIAAQEGHIGDEEAQGNVYDPANGATYSSELASLQQEAASLQQQENVAQAQFACNK